MDTSPVVRWSVSPCLGPSRYFIISPPSSSISIAIARTDMAGRGTDIILGGNPESEAKREMKKLGYTDEQISFADGYIKSDDEELMEARKKFNELHEQFKAERKEEQKKVIELGGLCILGTERHESRRIDNQLRGRSGRQGDPGMTQFYISMGELIRGLSGHGYNVGIVTSRMRGTTLNGLNNFGLTEYIGNIVTCEDTDKHKPDPEPALIALRNFGVTADEAIMVFSCSFVSRTYGLHRNAA